MKIKILTSALLFLLASIACAEEKTQRNSSHDQTWYAITYENDAFGLIDKSDDGYTSGMAGSWGYDPVGSFDELNLPQFIRIISQNSYLNQGEERTYAVAYSIAQGMYTPTDLEEEEVVEDDRPYAGTVLWTPKIYSYNNKRSDSLSLSLGLAGPLSLAGASQIAMHKAIGAEIPQGWDNQINSEPLVRLTAEHIERFLHADLFSDVGFDTNLFTQAGIGNLRSNLGAGLIFRLGTYLDESFAFVNPIASRGGNMMPGTIKNQFSWQLFLSVYGQYVFNDLTLEGNTFKESHGVELIHDQAVLSFGASMNFGRFGLIFSTQRSTNTFEGQVDHGSFGAATLSYHM